MWNAKIGRRSLKGSTDIDVSVQVPYVKVAPEDILKVQFPRFTTLDLRPTNTDISLAVAGLLTFFNSTTSCLICAQADCEYGIHTLTTKRIHTPGENCRTLPSLHLPTKCKHSCLMSVLLYYVLARVSFPRAASVFCQQMQHLSTSHLATRFPLKQLLNSQPELPHSSTPDICIPK